MKDTIWINKAESFEAARKFEDAYYRGLSGAERLETIQMLRETHFRLKGLYPGENRKRLRRVLRVIKQA
jgi:hypothetical protein